MALAAPAPSLALVNRDSDTWLDDLRGTGARREAATAELHTLLLRAARFELARRRSALAELDAAEIDDLAVQSANDALMAVLRKLDTYRGQSRFTTWAYKFALLEAGVKARRRAWRDRELAISDDHWALIAAEDPAPDAVAGTAATLAALRTAIRDRLTPHQREVLIALALDGVPIDVLAERRGTTRGALYKTLHDARRRLRAEVEDG